MCPVHEATAQLSVVSSQRFAASSCGPGSRVCQSVLGARRRPQRRGFVLLGSRRQASRGRQAWSARSGLPSVSAETKVLEFSRFEIAGFRWQRLLRTIVLDASSSAGLQAYQRITAASSCANPWPAAQLSRISKPAENRHVRAGAHTDKHQAELWHADPAVAQRSRGFRPFFCVDLYPCNIGTFY